MSLQFSRWPSSTPSTRRVIIAWPQKVIAENAGCSQSARRKRSTSIMNDHDHERTVNKSWFKHYSEWTESGVRATIHNYLQDRGYRHQTCIIRAGKELDYCSVFQSESCVPLGSLDLGFWKKSCKAQTQRCLNSSVKFLWSMMMWGGLMFMGFVHCILPKVNKANYQELLEHYMLMWKTSQRCWFPFQQVSASAHSATRWSPPRRTTLIAWIFGKGAPTQ